MFLLNLTAGEFLALFAALGGLITALYLLDRSKRKKIVSTLRFWLPARTAEERQSRRRMREPWSLILQLAGLALLLLAIAQLQIGGRERRGRDHVILLDTSAWSADKGAGGTVLDHEKLLARQYIAAVPSVDRIMLVRVDSLAVPATPFTSDRAQLDAAIGSSTSQFSALNLDQALLFASQARNWASGRQGEIVYVGGGLTADEASDVTKPSNLRILRVDPSRENAGIRRLGVKRDEEESNSWQATVTLKNYGAAHRSVRLYTQFAGTQFTPRTLTLLPGEETAAEYSFVTPKSGDLVARIVSNDGLASDDEAILRLPSNGPLRVNVYTKRPEALAPLLEANHLLATRFFSPAQYPSAQPGDVTVLDGFSPRVPPVAPALWIAPPRAESPFAVKETDYDTVIRNWNDDSAIGTGLRAKETHIPSAEVFELFENDTAVASTAAGPVVVAREANQKQPKMAVIGFDPLQGELKFEVTTPILFANLIRWLAPDSFRALDLSAARVGTAMVALDPHERTDHLRVVDGKGFAVPFTIRDRTLHFFAGRPTTVHIYSDGRERTLSLTLPDVAEFEWKPPATAARNLPAAAHFSGGPVDLWKWLTLGGLACLLAEWLRYGRQRSAKFPLPVSTKAAAVGAQSGAELAAK